jgi:hypothetical protein
MRAVLALMIGGVFLTASLNLFVLDEPIPFPLRIILGLFSLILIWAGLYHGRLRVRRYAAYHGGREKRGTLQLTKLIGEDDTIAELVFSTSFADWLMTVDAAGVGSDLEQSDQPAKATAFFGDDELIYGINLGDKRLLPLSPGKPMKHGDAAERIARGSLTGQLNQKV